MEYGHGENLTMEEAQYVSVLILLLMEYGHGDIKPLYKRPRRNRLNPSFNGIWSWR